MKRIIIINACEDCPYCKVVIQSIHECGKTGKVIKDSTDFENYCPLLSLKVLEEETLISNTTNEDDKISLIEESWKSLKKQSVVKEAFGSLQTWNP